MDLFIDMAADRIRREEDNMPAEDDSVQRMLVIRNYDRHLAPNGGQGPVDSFLLAQTQQFIKLGQKSRFVLVMQTTPEFDLPAELVVHCEYVKHELPTEEERSAVIYDLGYQDDGSLPLILSATAGLSRAKTTQYVAETLAKQGYIDPATVFRLKADHLARASKLDVWSPQFVQQTKLWPRPETAMYEATDLTMVAEENHILNGDVGEGEIRARVRYVKDGKKVEQWLDPMPKEKFEHDFRPERDFYSLKSVVGLNGLKDFLRRGLRPDVPDRSKMKHVLMLGVPGTGKSFMMQCCSGEFNAPLSSMQASNLYSKWLGDTDKILAAMLGTVERIGGILAIDEFQRFLPTGGGSESGGVENRLLGTLLTWFNNQNSNLVLSAANNIANLPDEITRSGRVDALMFVGFPGEEAKAAAWKMYLKRHALAKQETPKDEYWTPADIMACCRLAEMQEVSVVQASRWITPSYEKNRAQMDGLMEWAEAAGCICAETGERFKHPRHQKARTGVPNKVTRKVGKSSDKSAE
jgi:hypothetical protein